ncbi:MAG TPA: aminotransferase class I/II-fold pyridoxal phosphate-dependent enzyme [Syntrophomonadaceae bacterium]|nr:aminotransferase class I/II-fold pyridoxal phosphate-dependent enzyme [Syntrophomonadaceae bacterium]
MHSSKLIRDIEQDIHEVFLQLEDIAYNNQVKVLNAFRRHRIREVHFQSSSGYGYGDIGRDTLEELYADVFSAPSALVRSQIVSGTHAISSCLFGLLKPGDQLISAVGAPYDTLKRIIGHERLQPGSLVERGIEYQEVPLNHEQKVDLEALGNAINKQTRMVLIQRSRGYSLRPAVDLETIEQMVATIRSRNADTIIMVDNCYGEFVNTTEPTDYGIDLMAGSLIKNPGGGLAVSGGYIVGKHDLVEQIADYLTAPGLGRELGASLGQNRLFYQGLFLAPHTVLQALKGAVLVAAVFERLGFQVSPHWSDSRSDIVQAVILNDPQQIQKFCQTVQESSPVDSDVRLEYANMPGYTDKIIMAAGTFIQGSSIELSCDAPLRPPYTVFIQGGLSYEHVRYVVGRLIDELVVK